jgi:hypothetical protein
MKGRVAATSSHLTDTMLMASAAFGPPTPASCVCAFQRTKTLLRMAAMAADGHLPVCPTTLKCAVPRSPSAHPALMTQSPLPH